MAPFRQLALLLPATLVLAPIARSDTSPRAPVTPSRAATWNDYVLLAWNDLGMHCMNQQHARFSVLPPYNNLDAQLILRGDSVRAPQLVTSGVTLDYSVPGNTYSVGKTDFWTYAYALFGVSLPPDTGLTGLGLSGTMTLVPPRFRAEGIPLTPFPDATPTVENPYQQALVVARDGGGIELARATPSIPVSIELRCVTAGCHASETAILQEHPSVTGFDPAATPILCAGCHADPVLGTTGRPDADYFSFRMHDQHSFMDQTYSGTGLCYMCHPGQQARCLRGVMGNRFGLVCQDCHGGMAAMAASIQGGRVPWAQEPACRTCHTSRFGEPAGQLYRHSTGHGGVMCDGCHHSTHAEWSSALWADNADVVALQRVAGPLGACPVCHGVNPAGAGPHDILATDVPAEVLGGAAAMQVRPNPARGACTVEFAVRGGGAGTLLVFDAQGRTVRLLRPRLLAADRARAEWDARDQRGGRVGPGVYFVRWSEGAGGAAARVTLLE